MKTIISIMIQVALILSVRVIGQNSVNLKTVESKNLQIKAPETSTGYIITSYKNVDFSKTNPMQLEAAGLHTEIYISNTNLGVIIISSSEANNALRDFSNTLDLNPALYESVIRQDTTVFFTGNNNKTYFDFAKASSLKNNYKNAFNYTADPRTGVSWKKSYDKANLKKETFAGQILYDIIIGLPKY
jgi:UDP-N-acetyl-D-mannosaminuronic acid transferase (WecB/TagA/CpsF family)